MKQLADTEIIERFKEFCRNSGNTEKAIGDLVGRSESWVSKIMSGQINGLMFSTRNRILKVLGLQRISKKELKNDRKKTRPEECRAGNNETRND